MDTVRIYDDELYVIYHVLKQANGGGGQSQKSIHTVTMSKRNATETWGFRLHGGKDRGLALQLLKVPT